MKLLVTPVLSKILKQKGITQAQLSEMSGVPQGSISRFDKNERHVASHVFSIAKALEISSEDLFEITEHNNE